MLYNTTLFLPASRGKTCGTNHYTNHGGGGVGLGNDLCFKSKMTPSEPLRESLNFFNYTKGSFLPSISQWHKEIETRTVGRKRFSTTFKELSRRILFTQEPREVVKTSSDTHPATETAHPPPGSYVSVCCTPAFLERERGRKRGRKKNEPSVIGLLKKKKKRACKNGILGCLGGSVG